MIQKVRKLHFYLGLFFAPSILFFAFTGALQTFGLHESHNGSAYQPPAWIQTFASIHKDQRLRHGLPGAKGPAAHPGSNLPLSRPLAQRSSQPLKWFVLSMAVGLISTTGLGIWMAFLYNRPRYTIGLCLILGSLLPVLLLFL